MDSGSRLVHCRPAYELNYEQQITLYTIAETLDYPDIHGNSVVSRCLSTSASHYLRS